MVRSASNKDVLLGLGEMAEQEADERRVVGGGLECMLEEIAPRRKTQRSMSPSRCTLARASISILSD